jgi:putative transposase
MKIFIMVFIWKRFDPLIHHRQSIRLNGYDYCSLGLYFITIRVHPGGPVLGHVLNGKTELNDFGNIVDDEWRKTPIIRPYVYIDAYVIMPDHFHGIIGIHSDPAPDKPFTDNDPVGATRRVAPTTRRVAPTTRPTGPKPGSIGAIIGQFKSQTTKRINMLRFEMGKMNTGATEKMNTGATEKMNTGATGKMNTGATQRVAPTGRVWQRNYYDHIIRDHESLERIRQYIIDNPSRCT